MYNLQELLPLRSGDCMLYASRCTSAPTAAAAAADHQIREKDIEGGAFLAEARAALKVCRAAGVPLVINDRVDIALALGPDVGVHVGQGDIPCAEVGEREVRIRSGDGGLPSLHQQVGATADVQPC